MWGLIGAAVSALGKYGYDQYKRTSNRSEKRDFHDYVNFSNYGYYTKSLQESPMFQRMGLEKAGYNPMLALGHIGSSSFSGSQVASGDISTEGDLVGSAAEGAKLGNDLAEGFKNVNDETKSKTTKNEAEADATKAGISQENRRLDQVDKKLEQEDKRIQIEQQRETRESINDALDSVRDIGYGVGSAYMGKKSYDYYRAWQASRGAKIIDLPMKNIAAKNLGRFLVPLVVGSTATGISLLNSSDVHKKIHYDDEGNVKKDKSWKEDLSRMLFVPSFRR